MTPPVAKKANDFRTFAMLWQRGLQRLLQAFEVVGIVFVFASPPSRDHSHGCVFRVAIDSWPQKVRSKLKTLDIIEFAFDPQQARWARSSIVKTPV